MIGADRPPARASDRRASPIYINWYINGYGRPWTPVDVNPKMRHVHGQIAGSEGVLLPTTEQKAFPSTLDWLKRLYPL